MKQAIFVRHKRERNVYHVVWFEQGRERARSYPTRQEAEQEKQRRLELLAQGNAPEPFDLLPPHEKRELFAIHERAREKGYELWDVARLHERQLKQQRVPGIEIGKAVKRCLEDKEAEGVSPRSLQSLRSVLLRFASRHEGRLMDELDAADATTFVDTLGVSLRTRLGYLTDLRTSVTAPSAAPGFHFLFRLYLRLRGLCGPHVMGPSQPQNINKPAWCRPRRAQKQTARPERMFRLQQHTAETIDRFAALSTFR